jgi:hypothetical protein
MVTAAAVAAVQTKNPLARSSPSCLRLLVLGLLLESAARAVHDL